MNQHANEITLTVIDSSNYLNLVDSLSPMEKAQYLGSPSSKARINAHWRNQGLIKGGLDIGDFIQVVHGLFPENVYISKVDYANYSGYGEGSRVCIWPTSPISDDEAAAIMETYNFLCGEGDFRITKWDMENECNLNPGVVPMVSFRVKRK